MKKFTLLTLLAGASVSLNAQQLPGFSTGNYTGVAGVFFNPANIAESRYRFDIQVYSMDFDVGSNQVPFAINNIGNTFKGDSLRNQLFGARPGSTSILMRVNIQGPSVMLRLPAKFAVALTTRARIIANVRNVDQQLVNSLINAQNSDGANLPYTLQSSGNMALNVNAWKEIGATVAREIAHGGPSTLSAGLTLRYLMGIGNAYMNIQNLNGTLAQDPITQQPYLTNTAGSLGMGFAGVDLSNFKANQLFQTHGNGVGADLGLVYEFKPVPVLGYLFRAGASLLDVGSITYSPEPQSTGTFNVHIPNNSRYYLSDLDSVSLSNYKQHFESVPQYFTESDSGTAKYKVSLPTRIQLDFDYHAILGLYVNLSAQLSVASGAKAYNPIYYNTYTLTPRYETKIFGAYLPLSYNALTGTNVGVALRVGPLYLGSGSIISALIGHTKEPNVFLGIHIGFLKH